MHELMVGPNNFISSFGRGLVGGGITQGLVIDRVEILHSAVGVTYKVLGKVWPGFKYKYDLDVYDLRQFQIFYFFKEYFHRYILYPDYIKV